MKKYIFYIIAFMSLQGLIIAQDQIFKKDNSKVEAKILEINQNEIKYKLFTYQDGPTIIIAKKEVALIIYQNGTHEVITAAETQVPHTPSVIYNNPINYSYNEDSIKKREFSNLISTKNIVFLNIIEPLNGSFGLSYMREFANNYLHAYVPISAGFATPYFTQAVNTIFSGNSYSSSSSSSYFSISNFQFKTKTYEVGIGLHFQTSGKRKVTHFVGPYVGVCQFTGSYDKTEGVYNPINGYYSSTSFSQNTFTLNRTYVMLDNGLFIRATKNFNIMLLAGVGYHIDNYTSADDLTKASNFNKTQFPINAFKFGLSFGYRF